MKIAVFARGLTARPTGRGMFAREMIQAIRRVQPDAEIYLFSGENPDWDGVRWRPATGAGVVGEAWRLLRGIAREVADIEPDVIWGSTHVMPYGLPSGLARVVTLLDVVWRDHPDTMSAKNRYVSAWQERGLREADRIACISAFTRDRLIEHWPDLADRASVVHLAGSRAATAAGDMSSSRPYVVNVDTIEPRKNLGILLDVMTHLPDLQLVQCGTIGWGVDRLTDRARAMPSVTLRGYVSDAELGPLYRGAVAAVFPSIYEGFHLPPLDALNAGCPVIASDIPVHREVLGEAAVFVPSRDPKAWVEAISRIRTDAAHRARLAAAGPPRAACFSWDDSAANLLRVFRSAIDSARTQGRVKRD